MKSLRSIQRMLEEFYEIDPKIDLNSIGAFLLIAAAGSGGIRRCELVEIMDRPKGTISRFVSRIGDGPVNRGKPYRLISERPDPEDARGKIVTLNAKGERLKEALVSALGK